MTKTEFVWSAICPVCETAKDGIEGGELKKRTDHFHARSVEKGKELERDRIAKMFKVGGKGNYLLDQLPGYRDIQNELLKLVSSPRKEVGNE